MLIQHNKEYIMKITKYVLGPVQTNCYLLEAEDTNDAVLIDPGDKSREIADYIDGKKLKIKYIINTHGHFDHTGGNAFFHSADTEIAAHRLAAELIASGGGASSFGLEVEQSPAPSIDTIEGGEIIFGSEKLEILHTPGHTQGHISLYHRKSGSLFCGDVLFFRSIGRSDFPGGDHKQLIDSIKNKLYSLPDETKVYPGHGPATVIGDEKKNNPWTA